MSKRTDISQQIRKYLNGKLDAHAMHQLEREAQNDPFLAEALEGYEKAGSNQEQNLGDVHARLQERITEKTRRIVLWRTISIAASVLIVLAIGGLWLKNEQPEVKSKRIATHKIKPSAPINNTPPINNIAQHGKKTTSPVIAKRSSVNKAYMASNAAPVRAASTAPAPPGISDINADKSIAAMDVKIDSARLGEVIVTGYGTAKRKAFTGSVATIQPSQVINKDTAVAINALAGKVAGIQLKKSGIKTITGTIVAKEDGLPIPGVTIKIKGTTTATQTNSNGQFTINSVPDGSTLDIAFIGYDSQQILVHKKDSLTITMQANSNELSEVVVTSALGVKSQEEEYQSAHPLTGWGDFKQYLKKNTISPDGKTGVVKLSFIVNTDNSLSDFKIIKSVSAKTDSAAIALVKNGSGWIKNTDSKPQKIKLKIKFTGK